MSERYITAAELADSLGVSRRTVAYWTAAGCPSETWGMRVRRFRVSEVVAWLRAADTVLGHSPRPQALQRRRG